MTTEEARNFRSFYYGKVGCRGVEEKKSLEILLKDRPWDKTKLKQFCLRFTLPTYYRNLIWKILLGIVPVQSECQQFVKEQRESQATCLQDALLNMQLTDAATSRSRRVFAMWYLDSGQWLFDNLKDAESGAVAMCETVLKVFSDDVDAFWVMKRLHELSLAFERDAHKLSEATRLLLEKQDDVLYRHLSDIKSLSVLPLTRWFKFFFAGMLDDSSLVKIWDKLCAGSPKILSFVAVVLIIKCRSSILRAEDSRQVLKCVARIPDQTEEVANKALDLWQRSLITTS